MSKKLKKITSFERSTVKIFKTMGYQLGKTIGKGTYSKVCIALSSHGKRLACKIIDKRNAGEDFITKFLPRELVIITGIKHPNIIEVYKIVEINKAVYMFMDYCRNGDLLEYIRNRGPFAEEKAKYFYGQIINAIHYLHTLDIAHRDLKCENILLMWNNQVKLGDFGFARYCKNRFGAYLLSNTFCGSAAYAAPEILQGMFYDPKTYDIWALGCILYVMMTASMPFDDSNVKRMIEDQLSWAVRDITKTWDEWSSNLGRLQNVLLEPDPLTRITANEVVKHPWFRQGGSNKTERFLSLSDSLLL